MLGDWGGHRSRLAEHGLNFDIYSTNFFNDVANGGLQETFQSRGRMDYLLNIDGEKAGLWKGLFIDLHGETHLRQHDQPVHRDALAREYRPGSAGAERVRHGTDRR